jgi:hypothetical protein
VLRKILWHRVGVQFYKKNNNFGVSKKLKIRRLKLNKEKIAAILFY